MLLFRNSVKRDRSLQHWLRLMILRNSPNSQATHFTRPTNLGSFQWTSYILRISLLPEELIQISFSLIVHQDKSCQRLLVIQRRYVFCRSFHILWPFNFSIVVFVLYMNSTGEDHMWWFASGSNERRRIWTGIV